MLGSVEAGERVARFGDGDDAGQGAEGSLLFVPILAESGGE